MATATESSIREKFIKLELKWKNSTIIYLIPTIAGNAQDSQSLTLKDAIKYALENKKESKKNKIKNRK
jgi:hypothetical protein